MTRAAGVVAIFALAGCHPPAPVLAKLARQACLGTCPVYTILVRTDGEVEYRGTAHLLVVGHRSARLSATALAKLEAETMIDVVVGAERWVRPYIPLTGC